MVCSVSAQLEFDRLVRESVKADWMVRHRWRVRRKVGLFNYFDLPVVSLAYQATRIAEE